MTCDLEVSNESVLLGRNFQLYNKDWYWLILLAFKFDCHQTRFVPLRSNASIFALLIWPQNSLYFCVGQEEGAVKRKSGSEGENKVGRDGNRSFSLRSVRLRLICQFACMCENLMHAPWKAILGEKTPTVSNIYLFLRALNFETIENVSEEIITRNAQSSFRWTLKGDAQGGRAQLPSSGW